MIPGAHSRQERDLSASRHTLFCLVACGLAVTPPSWAGSWCDVVFKDVARDATAVVLTRVENPKGEHPTLRIIDVIKGVCNEPAVSLAKRELERYELKRGDQVLLALDDDLLPIRATRGLGICEPVSLLPIRGGRLHSTDRLAYDNGRKAMTLDELRRQLQELDGCSGDVGLDR
jgi:hypothetical protein